MTAFLLIWSPRKWPWPELPEFARRVRAGEAVADTWGCGFARGILPGDRVFLHRVAADPRGLFGSGYVTRAPYEVPDAAYKRGYRLCIDFVYDWLVDAGEEVVIARDALRAHPYSVQTWDAQSSGTVIKPIAEGALEKRWAQLTGRRPMPAPALAAMRDAMIVAASAPAVPATANAPRTGAARSARKTASAPGAARGTPPHHASPARKRQP
ncbi:MAG TPA: hypothetical protein VMJ11_18660 [Paraburkholderia sp.]|uniref:hypothetical protein n=1 Tax=Paraburkholderia sp. TaxID=1926495 RepID=UPI002CAF7632|nr:hypothetical protein [Paraburkholderia sp.]HTR08634.1 hypothetical protein [Paraburkholderia sp.]